MKRLRSIQVLRGVAATAVVLFHARYYSDAGIGGSPMRLGAAGVDLFFVISGYIMASIAKPSPGRFLFDRAWRILPLWLIAVAPWIALRRPDVPTLLASLTLWPVYGRFTMPALGVGWTLSFELLFYLSVALATSTKAWVPLGLFAVSLVAGTLTHAPIFDLMGNPIIFEFLLGAIVARLPRDTRAAIPLLLIAIFGFATAPFSVYRAEVAITAAVSAWRAAVWGLPAALMLYGCLCCERQFDRPIWMPLALLGDASYSIYLFHLGIIQVLHLPWPVEFVCAVAGGILAWRFIETPILRSKRLLIRQLDAARKRAPVNRPAPDMPLLADPEASSG